jgi:hypothetical protein
MNQYKTVLTKMRLLYSPEAEEETMLKQTCEGLKEVTDLQRVTPREFTPVEDTNEYLRK